MPWFGFPSISRTRDIIPFIQKVISKTLSETVTIGETLERISYLFRSVSPALSYTSSSFTASFGGSEGIALSGVVSAIRIKVRELRDKVMVPWSQSFTTSSFTTGSFNFNLAVETLTRVTIKARDLAESIVTTGTPTLVRTLVRGLSDTVTISEALDRTRIKVRALAETVSLSDSLARVMSKARTITETVTLSDQVTAAKIKGRLITETVTISEALALNKINGRLVTETVTISEAVAATRIRPRSIAETITISDNAARTRILVRGLTETITLSDVSERTRIRLRTNTETVSLSDALTRVMTKTREIPQTVSLSDVATRVTSKFRSILALPETISLIENVARIATKTRALSETITLTDATRIGTKIIKSLVETVTLIDGVTRTILGAGQWVVAGKVTDFTDKLDNLVKTYVAAQWTSTAPAIGTNLSTQAQQDNFDYDKFRTYYIQIKEGKSRVVNRQIRQRLYEFETPIEFVCTSRRLSRGESFNELNNMINELLRIFGKFVDDDIFGIRGITFESITPLGTDSANKSVWTRSLTIILHFYKSDNSPL